MTPINQGEISYAKNNPSFTRGGVPTYFPETGLITTLMDS